MKLHLSQDKAKDKFATASTIRCLQKWMIIYHTFVDPRPALEIVKHGVRKYFCSFVAVAPALGMVTVCKGLVKA